MWNDAFELPDGSYSVSDIQGYYVHIIEKHKTVTDNPSIKIYVNKVENRITFKIKTGYYLQLLTPGTMKLLGSTKSKITKDENSGNMPHIVLVHCNIVNNDYQHYSSVLYTFDPNKSLGQLLDISWELYHKILQRQLDLIEKHQKIHTYLQKKDITLLMI